MQGNISENPIGLTECVIETVRLQHAGLSVTDPDLLHVDMNLLDLNSGSTDSVLFFYLG